ncbi:hypothetical protein PF005_g4805 [Phytophthora fragariae]|uniref:Uncharacterized protein n=2 Tax=Phytophthora TaxID=4783 RepID=A0A6A3T5D5_9STRA|nr:hypothetical protein PF003_g19222 [Phytophthora fragariae]KAE9041239.1 hypothetical protein PR002_g4567 [Phytophthora rubi]KAE8945130.1 hypothetical protein PF009_g5206 [Phytophthora fragariae]KAE9019710.1 hypothetical protein PF011_g5706 [Phytophthora fragariae]KAE9047125.1 hypothetical protein PR001_g4335 [Phytophthora rubi]
MFTIVLHFAVVSRAIFGDSLKPWMKHCWKIARTGRRCCKPRTQVVSGFGRALQSQRMI